MTVFIASKWYMLDHLLMMMTLFVVFLSKCLPGVSMFVYIEPPCDEVEGGRLVSTPAKHIPSLQFSGQHHLVPDTEDW